MGMKKGIFQKLKFCYYWLTSPNRKNILAATCGFCSSSNLIAFNQNNIYVDKDEQKYTAKILCMECKASAEVNQIWKHLTEEQIATIKKELGR